MSEQFATDVQEHYTSYGIIHGSFEDMSLEENLLRGILRSFEKPTAIQQRGIVPFGKGLDVIQQAQSGTGKTATLCSGILQQLDFSLTECQAFVLTPTRLRARKIAKVIDKLGEYLHVKVCACVKGAKDQDILSNGVHVVVATPDRVFNLLDKWWLQPDFIRIFVLDKFDELLSRNFKEKIYDIFHMLPSKIQVGVFSATMPPQALAITRKFMTNPEIIRVKRDELTLEERDELTVEGIKQFYINVEEDMKVETLYDLYETLLITQCVIFVNTRQKVHGLTDEMRRHDYIVSAIHDDMNLDARYNSMVEFCSGSSRVLITNDLVRGFDVQQVSLVIHFDIPTQHEKYLHHIGRSGMSDRKGVAISFVTNKELMLLFNILDFAQVKIKELPANAGELQLLP
ncbi:eukaryotic initiation factor 4A-2-like [Trifolium medium]|uniref:RNA helicase n=1 Tax=Trifolium medium TaxID=97028 RepID=A0A392LZW0_9FABA|nr:eukaryotic initiation factor 4A-2-like [Trifolium medium]